MATPKPKRTFRTTTRTSRKHPGEKVTFTNKVQRKQGK